MAGESRFTCFLSLIIFSYIHLVTLSLSLTLFSTKSQSLSLSLSSVLVTLRDRRNARVESFPKFTLRYVVLFSMHSFLPCRIVGANAGKQVGWHLLLTSLRPNRRQIDCRHPRGQEFEENGRRWSLWWVIDFSPSFAGRRPPLTCIDWTTRSLRQDRPDAERQTVKEEEDEHQKVHPQSVL